jgi:hypothetical protein
MLKRRSQFALNAVNLAAANATLRLQALLYVVAHFHDGLLDHETSELENEASSIVEANCRPFN